MRKGALTYGKDRMRDSDIETLIRPCDVVINLPPYVRVSCDHQLRKEESDDWVRKESTSDRQVLGLMTQFRH